MSDPVLVEVTRGEFVESRHEGAVCVVDAAGAVVLSLGDIDRPVFPRSAVKAIQALPLIEGGGAERYQLTAQEIALICASHSGEPEHVEVAAGILAKAGCETECLECGTHWPSSDRAARELARAQAHPTALHNNCSGKHAGFVCLACLHEEAVAGYIDAGHPVQQAVRAALEETTGAAHSADRRATDGCSIPTYAVPLKALALGFARFGTGHGMGAERARAAATIRRAVAAAPFYVAGTNRLDTQVMERLGERVFMKTGAEGVYCGAFPELGLGVALKCDDGGGRAAQAAMAAVIARFLPLEGEDRAFIAGFADVAITNWNGIEVGRVRATKDFAGRP